MTIDVGAKISKAAGSSQNRVEPGSTNIPVGKFPVSSTFHDASRCSVSKISQKLIDDLNNSLSQRDYDAISSHFLNDGYWRDHLAISWDIRTLKGRGEISNYLREGHQLTSLEIDASSAFREPRFGPLDGIGDTEGIQFFIKFTTELGRGQGMVRLSCGSKGVWQILCLFTGLRTLNGCDEPLGFQRARGSNHRPVPNAQNWKDRRKIQEEFNEADPDVLIIGAGQGGLSTAARLKMANVESLVIDKENEIGDNWRQRYHQLVLHDPVWYNHMPYFKFPDHWPIFTPKDKMADFLQMYVSCLELNVWTRSTLSSPVWDDTQKRWTVTIRRHTKEGETQIRVLHPKHIVQATGHSGEKHIPHFEGVANFKGDRICHSSEFPGADPESGKKGKRAVVIGSCNSAHDIAQDLYVKGYDVTMIQRSSTCVVSSKAVVDISIGGLYHEGGPPVEDADLWLWSLPSELLKAQQIKVTAIQKKQDAQVLQGLEKVGFKVDNGPDGAGLLMKYFQRGGGYYIDIGASQLIVDGKIKVRQGVEIQELLPNGLRLSDGAVLPADEIILATGYQNMRSQTRSVFGEEVADRVNDVWGFDEEGEVRTMWRKSGHPGLWFMGGNLAVTRYYSHVLSLQIKAAIEGLSS